MWTRLITGALRIPLAAKLAGANALLAVIIVTAMLALQRAAVLDQREMAAIIILTGATSLAINFLLVDIALEPVRHLEATAREVARGNYAARVPASPLTDAGVKHVGRTFNVILDKLIADRDRARRLALEVIGAGDRESARIARELHESMAQTLAGLTYQLSALANDLADTEFAGRADEGRRIATALIHDVRSLSNTVHPRVLDDLGLDASLRALARETELRTGIGVEVWSEYGGKRIPPAVASALYRVAKEGLRNAVSHAGARLCTLELCRQDDHIVLQVFDDGEGFDVASTEQALIGSGLFVMRERVVLMNGSFEITSRRGMGTTIHASIPVPDIPAARVA
jgi:signal transduction histidine kinase